MSLVLQTKDQAADTSYIAHRTNLHDSSHSARISNTLATKRSNESTHHTRHYERVDSMSKRCQPERERVCQLPRLASHSIAATFSSFATPDKHSRYSPPTQTTVSGGFSVERVDGGDAYCISTRHSLANGADDCRAFITQ